MGYLWSYLPRRAAANNVYKSARASFEEASRELYVNLVDRALTVHDLEQQAILMDSVMLHTERVVQAMQARFDIGDISEYDLRRLQTEVLLMHQQRIELTRKLQEAKQDFTNLAGLPASELSDIDLDVGPVIMFPSIDDAVEAASKYRPVLQSNKSSIVAAEMQYRAEKRNQLPEVSLGIGYKTVDPDFTGLTLEAEIELPFFHQRRSERMYAKVSLEQAHLQQNAARLVVAEEVRGAFELRKALATESAYLGNYEANQSQIDIDRGVKMYLQGELSAVEFSDVLRSSLESLEAYLQLNKAQILAELDLRRVTGLPIVEQQ